MAVVELLVLFEEVSGFDDTTLSEGVAEVGLRMANRESEETGLAGGVISGGVPDVLALMDNECSAEIELGETRVSVGARVRQAECLLELGWTVKLPAIRSRT